MEDTDSSKSLEITGQHVSDLRKAAASPVPLAAAASALLLEAAVGLREAAVGLREAAVALCKSADVLQEAAAVVGDFAVVASEAAVVLCESTVLTFKSVFALCGTAAVSSAVVLPCGMDFVVFEEVLMICKASVAMLPSFVLLRDAGLVLVRDGCWTPLKVARKIPGTVNTFSVTGTERREKRHHLVTLSYLVAERKPTGFFYTFKTDK